MSSSPCPLPRLLELPPICFFVFAPSQALPGYFALAGTQESLNKHSGPLPRRAAGARWPGASRGLGGASRGPGAGGRSGPPGRPPPPPAPCSTSAPALPHTCPPPRPTPPTPIPRPPRAPQPHTSSLGPPATPLPAAARRRPAPARGRGHRLPVPPRPAPVPPRPVRPVRPDFTSRPGPRRSAPLRSGPCEPRAGPRGRIEPAPAPPRHRLGSGCASAVGSAPAPPAPARLRLRLRLRHGAQEGLRGARCPLRGGRLSALHHPHAGQLPVQAGLLLQRRLHPLPLQGRHHHPRPHGRRHHHLHRCHYLGRGGLPGLHGASLLQVGVQQLPGRPLQGGGDFPLRGGHQPVPDRPGQVHDRPPPAELPGRLQSRLVQGELLPLRAAGERLPGREQERHRVQTVLLLRALLLRHVLHGVPGALRASPPGVEVGPPAAPHHPVLPHRLRRLRGLHPGLRLQAPLERRAGGAAAGRPHRRPHRPLRLRLLQAPSPAAVRGEGRGAQAQPAPDHERPRPQSLQLPGRPVSRAGTDARPRGHGRTDGRTDCGPRRSFALLPRPSRPAGVRGRPAPHPHPGPRLPAPARRWQAAPVPSPAVPAAHPPLCPAAGPGGGTRRGGGGAAPGNRAKPRADPREG